MFDVFDFNKNLFDKKRLIYHCKYRIFKYFSMFFLIFFIIDRSKLKNICIFALCLNLSDCVMAAQQILVLLV